MKTQRFPFALSYWTGEHPETKTLLAGKHFYFDLGALNDFCLCDLPRHLVDLLRISSAVYVVDRLVKRRPKSFSRTIGLKIGVLESSLWKRQKIRDCVQEILEFVTGDFWDIEFEQDTQPFYGYKQLLADPYDGHSPLICLYSGGLDSGAGLATRMNDNPSRPVIPVTAWHQPRQKHLVKQHYSFLRDHYRKNGSCRIDPVIVKVGINWALAAEKKQQEHSQRSRSFLFATLGAITAIMHGQKSIEMFESGIGAINLPLMAGMVGSKATKSSHPKFLRLMSNLCSLVTDEDIKFTLPFFNKTKGELVKTLAADNLCTFATMTSSCIHYPIRNKSFKQCGLCPACIFRRAAIHSAGIDEPLNAYKFDFLGQSEISTKIPDKQLTYLKAFLLQVAHLRNISNNIRLPQALERHVVPQIVKKGESQKDIIQLLIRYRDEWEATLSAAREKGHAWARLLAPKHSAIQGVTHASS